MREIKFRGKSFMTVEELCKFDIPHENGWVYGSLITNGGFPFIVGDIVDHDSDYIAPDFWVKVDPETVGQYTGLKDKNGVEIYEGDIVKKESGFGLGHREGKPKYGKVMFYKDAAAYCVEYKDQREIDGRYAHLVHTESDLEVVCNIFENPELLEEENHE